MSIIEVSSKKYCKTMDHLALHILISAHFFNRKHHFARLFANTTLFSYPYVPLRSAHTAMEIASSRRTSSTPCCNNQEKPQERQKQNKQNGKNYISFFVWNWQMNQNGPQNQHVYALDNKWCQREKLPVFSGFNSSYALWFQYDFHQIPYGINQTYD